MLREIPLSCIKVAGIHFVMLRDWDQQKAAFPANANRSSTLIHPEAHVQIPDTSLRWRLPVLEVGIASREGSRKAFRPRPMRTRGPAHPFPLTILSIPVY